MKKLILSLTALSILGLVSIGGFAQGTDLKERVTFRDKVWVNTTAIEPGDYLVKYDAKTGELAIVNGKKVIATAKASVKTNDKKATGDALLTSTTSSGTKLNGLRFNGQREEIVITDVSAEMSKANQ